MATMMEQNFCVYEIDDLGDQREIPLKDHGYETMVNSQNKCEYL